MTRLNTTDLNAFAMFSSPHTSPHDTSLFYNADDGPLHRTTSPEPAQAHTERREKHASPASADNSFILSMSKPTPAVTPTTADHPPANEIHHPIPVSHMPSHNEGRLDVTGNMHLAGTTNTTLTDPAAGNAQAQYGWDPPYNAIDPAGNRSRQPEQHPSLQSRRTSSNHLSGHTVHTAPEFGAEKPQQMRRNKLLRVLAKLKPWKGLKSHAR